MQLIATHINYYFICKRKLWLFANGISMEHTSDAVSEGKLIGDTTYPQRPEKYTEVELSYARNDTDLLKGKIDFYDAANKEIHEIKKTKSMEPAHEWQVRFYIWLLELNGVAGATGKLEYPASREIKPVSLTDADKKHLESIVADIERITNAAICPGKINSKICKKCSYYDLCYIAD